MMERKRVLGWECEFIMFMDMDTFVPGHTISEMVRFLGELPRSVGAVQPRLLSTGFHVRDSNLLGTINNLMYCEIFEMNMHRMVQAYSYFDFADCLYGPCVMYRYEAILAIYGELEKPIPYWDIWTYDSKHFSDDLYMTVQTLCQGYSTRMVPHVAAYVQMCDTYVTQLNQLRRWRNSDVTATPQFKIPAALRLNPLVVLTYLIIGEWSLVPIFTAFYLYSIAFFLKQITDWTRWERFGVTAVIALLIYGFFYGQKFKTATARAALSALWYLAFLATPIMYNLFYYALDDTELALPLTVLNVVIVVWKIVTHGPPRAWFGYLLSQICRLCTPYLTLLYMLYATANYHEVSWGTRENDTDVEEARLQLERERQAYAHPRDSSSPAPAAGTTATPAPHDGGTHGAPAGPAPKFSGFLQHLSKTILTYETIPTLSGDPGLDLMLGVVGMTLFSAFFLGLALAWLALLIHLGEFWASSLFLSLTLAMNLFILTFTLLDRWRCARDKIAPFSLYLDPQYANNWRTFTWNVLYDPIWHQDIIPNPYSVTTP
eukprot:CAMPEP_0119159174 /NCGR_PEP_ID=MMETSP1310-20130426/53629_1 /TAXON_ID=464262 /ORGANISM="Genus nov. species nov., Strain RCC2339" /LENGTH=544 /DNA_ID=CAMNT_0007151803 /DNA_START=184 /DNA_END=1818 /DNA_ORIENTATION=+